MASPATNYYNVGLSFPLRTLTRQAGHHIK
jgi:hypothetical protein